jgi:glyoxylase-like metal-dependent hydrolase (beta-lactamase superfamily II)
MPRLPGLAAVLVLSSVAAHAQPDPSTVQLAPLTPKLKAAVAAVTDQALRFVVNTHWHFDHSGGNKDLGESGTLIVAHDNVRTRMSTEPFIKAFNMKIPPSPDKALPVVTFDSGQPGRGALS